MTRTKKRDFSESIQRHILAVAQARKVDGVAMIKADSLLEVFEEIRRAAIAFEDEVFE